ncbi:hypothetical protein FACS1894190_12650 [Spirochaetia bacterium]|nr:hypothetical protein FACS1894190_12650 [Spirochaetia bacterium]
MKNLHIVPRCLTPRCPAAKQRVLNPECNYSEKKWPASMRRVFLFVCSVILISFLPVTGCEQFAAGVGIDFGADTSEVVTPPLTGSVDIEGNAAIGERLTADTKKLDGTGKITYKWTKSGSSTTISKTATYIIKQADNNSQIKVTVTREGYTGTKFATKTIGNPPFEMGDEGPAGGTIIYDNTDHSEGNDWDYLEAAPEDLEAFAWASEGKTTTPLTGPFSKGIGSGKENTRLILAEDSNAPAAKAASEYEHNGFSDWFLPSIDELDLIYANTEVIKGGFDGNFYWSSNQTDRYTACYQDFAEGTPHYDGSKDDAYHVRPVRAFLNTPTPTPTDSPTPEPTPSPTTTDSPTPEPTPSPTSTSTPAPPPAPITYTAAVDGSATATSTKIDFTFSAVVTGLTANDITIGGSTGAATKGALTGSGTSYSLAITTTEAGAATMSINFSGIEGGTKNINLYRYVTYTTAANGGATSTSTRIDFTFSAVVTGLTANDITIGGSPGAATKGALSGSGNYWILDITVGTAGAATVTINKTGIENTAKTITLYKPDVITYTAAANGSPTATSTKIDFTFSASVTGLLAEHITVGGLTGAATKGALTGGGTSWSLAVTVATAGTVTATVNSSGIDSGAKTVTLYKQITYTAVVNGDASTASTKIDFTFSAAVTDLTAGHITVGGSTGAATKGALTGSGTSYSLAITTTAAGTATVSISKSGIESGAKTVTLFYIDLITYFAAANGGTTAMSTAITFNFSSAPSGFTADNITISGTGAATKGTLTGSGTSYSLAITTTATGAATVSINKSGIEGGTKNINLYRYITYTATTDGSPTASSTRITFTFNYAISSLSNAEITIGGSPGVAAKGVVSGSGTTWNLAVTVGTAGAATVAINQPGIESGTKNINLYRYVTYTTAANGYPTSNSTRIDFNFSESVSGLTAADITIGGSPGAATKGALSGSGIYWILDITVGTAGAATVAINKTGIENTAKSITLYKPITYTATADGNASTATTKIDFTFSAAVSGLTADHITIGGSPGAATKGALTGGGTAWSLAITTTVEGSGVVSINKSGIESGTKSIILHKYTPITYTATANGYPTSTSTRIDFNFSESVSGLTAADITIGGSTGAATKGALTGSGTSYSLAITTSAAGAATVSINKSGIESTTKSITLYKPVTYNATPDGSATATSTKIDFTFSSAPGGFSGNDITISGTGAATKGNLTNTDSTHYSLAITTNAAGTATVSVNRSGIENTAKSITLYKPATYNATANGSPTARTTKIDFTFNESVSGLQAEHITISGTGAATKGALTGSGTSYSLAVTPTAVGEATVSINKSGILSGTKAITLYDPLIAAIKSNSPDLSIKLGITTGGTSTVQHVTDTFNAIHNYLALGPEVKERTNGSPGMPEGLPTKIGGIALGDYIDLVSLYVDTFVAIEPVNFGSNPPAGDGRLLRLIVVGINSFNQGLGTYYDGNGNGYDPHIVFQFQNSPVRGSMTAGAANQPDYKESGMREYLTGNSNKFRVALINAGVPQARMWAPGRIVGNKAGGADELVDLVWLPTEMEMFGNRTYSPGSETEWNQARLAYYLGNNTRKKLDGTVSFINYWTASTLQPVNDAFTAVSADGTPSTGSVGNQGGIAPAFCIR